MRHVGIVVSDLERSLNFYRDQLGLKVERVMEESGPFADSLLALEGVELTTVKMSATDGPTLVELLHFRSPASVPSAARSLQTVGPSHVAFTVENLDKLYAKLVESGITFNAPPQLSPDRYAKVAYCRDPDGTPLELVEVLKDPK